jgi:hypothetical protein
MENPKPFALLSTPLSVGDLSRLLNLLKNGTAPGASDKKKEVLATIAEVDRNEKKEEEEEEPARVDLRLPEERTKREVINSIFGQSSEMQWGDLAAELVSLYDADEADLEVLNTEWFYGKMSVSRELFYELLYLFFPIIPENHKNPTVGHKISEIASTLDADWWGEIGFEAKIARTGLPRMRVSGSSYDSIVIGTKDPVTGEIELYKYHKRNNLFEAEGYRYRTLLALYSDWKNAWTRSIPAEWRKRQVKLIMDRVNLKRREAVPTTGNLRYDNSDDDTSGTAERFATAFVDTFWTVSERDIPDSVLEQIANWIRLECIALPPLDTPIRGRLCQNLRTDVRVLSKAELARENRFRERMRYLTKTWQDDPAFWFEYVGIDVVDGISPTADDESEPPAGRVERKNTLNPLETTLLVDETTKFAIFARALWAYAGNPSDKFSLEALAPLEALVTRDGETTVDAVRVYRFFDQFSPFIPDHLTVHDDTVGTKISEILMLLQTGFLRFDVTREAFEVELTDSPNRTLRLRPSTSEPGVWVIGKRINDKNELWKFYPLNNKISVKLSDDEGLWLRTVNELLLHVIAHTPGAKDLEANKKAVSILNPSSIQDFVTVRDWLNHIGLGRYADTFADKGWDDLETVLAMVEDDLETLGLPDNFVKIFLIFAKSWTPKPKED